MKVFVMWSGNESQVIAEGVSRLLENVIKGPSFFVSSRDIEIGRRWQDALSKRLREAHIGIACITPGQQNSRWMHFEAGAVSKMPGALVFPLLIGVSGISGPLEQYQTTDAMSREKMLALANRLNKARVAKRVVSDRTIRRSFQKHWPKFEPLIAKFSEGGSKSA